MLKGLLAGGITLGVAAVFPEALVFPFLAVVLGLMAGVNPGLAMADPQAGGVGLQWVVAALLVSLGMAGLWAFPPLLGGAFLLHALWGVAQKFTTVGEGKPEGFPRFCITYDTVLAGFAIYVWAAAR